MTNINAKTPCYIDLHLHLDGSIPVQTARKLAELQGISVPDDDAELTRMMSLTPECKTLEDYLDRFDFACSLLHTREALRIATHDLLSRLKEQGVIYAEIRFAPQKSCGKGLTQAEAVEGVIEGMKSVDMPSGLIVSMMREAGNYAENVETVLVAERYLGRGVVGLDIAGAEAEFPMDNYEELFTMAREKGIPFTIHCGEGDGPANMLPAIRFGARRIGHGVRSLEDESVVRQLADKGVTLELCPTSNIDTHIFPDYHAFPLRKFLDAGVKVTLNADDMTVSHITLADEWGHMCDTFNLTRAEVRQILLNAADASFATDEIKQQLRRQIWDAYPRVYILETDGIDEKQVDALLSELPSWRAEKAMKYKHFQGRKESVVSFYSLRKALREEFGIEDEIEFNYNEHGKPSLVNYPDIYFNMSHCKAAVGCAVSDTPIGIDVEMLGRYKESLARHVLNDDELNTVLSSENPDIVFTIYWTRKEALLKLIGSGVSGDMKDVLAENKDKKITTTVCDGYVYSVAE